MSQRVFDRFRMPGDDSEQDSRRAIRARPSLLPVPQGGRCETESRRELCLAEIQTFANCPDINIWNLNGRNAHRHLLPPAPCNCFVQTPDDPPSQAGLAFLFGTFFFIESSSFDTPRQAAGLSSLTRSARPATGFIHVLCVEVEPEYGDRFVIDVIDHSDSAALPFSFGRPP